MKKSLALVICLLLIMGGAHGARKALVIGNAGYGDSPLRNPVNDANLIATTLRELEFEVELVTDADLQQMESALNRFITALSPNDEALFYYSGHGANFNGDNYLIPLGWSFTDETELKYKAFNSNLALERLQKARLSIMILDACRDNPYRGARSGSKGLATMQGKSGSQYVIYSTEQGKTAADGSGSNSPFTESLVKHMKSPDRVEDVMKKVAIELKTKTSDKQIPWSGGTLVEDFYFAKALPGTEMRVTPRTQGLEKLTGDLRITTEQELELYVAKKSIGTAKPGYAFNLPDQAVGDLILEFFLENAKYSLKTSIYDNRVTNLEINSETLSQIRNEAFQTTVKSSPDGAEISFKDFPAIKGHTPFVIYDVFPASYELSLKATRYDELRTVIETGQQRSAEVNLKLAARYAELTIDSEPSGSRIWLNGKDMGTTPASFTGAQQGLDPGSWKLKLEPIDPMYLPVEKDLELKANQLYSEKLVHPQSSSGIQISSDIYPIVVSVDEGKAVTLNSTQTIKLTPGNYKVAVRFSGKDSRPIKTWQGTVEISREKPQTLDLKLIPQSGSLSFSSNLADYDIKIVNKDTSKTAKLNGGALVAYPGSFNLEAVKWGHYVINRDIEIKEGLRAEQRLDFEPVPKAILKPYSTWKTHQKISLASLALTLGISAFTYYRADQAHQDYLAADSPYSAQDARQEFEGRRNIFYGSCGLNILPVAYYIFSLSKAHQSRSAIELEMRSRLRK